MRGRSAALSVGFLLAAAVAGADEKAIPAFSAEVALRAEGEVVQRWTLESSGERIRVSPIDNDDLQTSLVDVASKRVWSFSGEGEDCTVATRDDPLADILGLPAESADEELLAEETVAGVKARKLRVKTTVEGRTETTIVWRAPELGNIPVRTLRPTDQVELVYRNIERSAPDAAGLSVPQGCPQNGDAPVSESP